MSLNSIDLTTHQLKDLYASVLVETEVKKNIPVKVKSEKKGQALKFLGKNNSGILILVNEPSFPFLPDQQLNFVTNILSACKLSLADVALVNVHDMEMGEIKSAAQELGANTIISFGIEPPSIGLPIQFPHYQIQKFDGLTYVHAPDLEKLEKEKDHKLQLWSSLKKLFAI